MDRVGHLIGRQHPPGLLPDRDAVMVLIG